MTSSLKIAVKLISHFNSVLSNPQPSLSYVNTKPLMIDLTTIPCGVKTSLVILFHGITSPPNLFNYKSSSHCQVNITSLAVIPSKSLLDSSILVILIHRMTSPQNPFDLCQVNITPQTATLRFPRGTRNLKFASWRNMSLCLFNKVRAASPLRRSRLFSKVRVISPLQRSRLFNEWELCLHSKWGLCIFNKWESRLHYKWGLRFKYVKAASLRQTRAASPLQMRSASPIQCDLCVCVQSLLLQ